MNIYRSCGLLGLPAERQNERLIFNLLLKMGVSMRYSNFLFLLSKAEASREQKVPFCRTVWWFCGHVGD